MANGPKPTLDACAALAAVISWSDSLPKIASGLAIIWYLYRGYEILKAKYGKSRG